MQKSEQSVLVKLFERECGADIVLRQIGREIVGHLPAGRMPTPAQLLEEVRRRAGPHYQQRWEECTDLEKLVLLQLAQEGVVNPHCDIVLRELMRRRLVRFEPEVRLMNESFRRFLLDLDPPATVVALEREGDSTWSAMRSVLWPALIVGVVFVAFTQRQIMQGYEAVIPLIGGGVTALSKLFDLVKVARVNAARAA